MIQAVVGMNGARWGNVREVRSILLSLLNCHCFSLKCVTPVSAPTDLGPQTAACLAWKPLKFAIHETLRLLCCLFL